MLEIPLTAWQIGSLALMMLIAIFMWGVPEIGPIESYTVILLFSVLAYRIL